MLVGIKCYNETKGVDDMADFCKECFKREFGSQVNYKAIVSKDLSLCEGCGEIKPVVLKVRRKRFWEK